MNADGLDVQLVHTEADWRDAVRYGEQVAVDVAPNGWARPASPCRSAYGWASRCARPAGPSTWS